MRDRVVLSRIVMFCLSSCLAASSIASQDIVEKAQVWKPRSSSRIQLNLQQSLQIRGAIEESFDIPRDKSRVSIANVRCRVEALESGFSEFVCQMKKGAMDYALISGPFAQQVFTALSEAGAAGFRDLGNDVVEVNNLECFAKKDSENYLEHKCVALQKKQRPSNARGLSGVR